MQNQVHALQKKNIKVATLNSSIKKADKEKIRLDLHSKRPDTKLLYVTPGITWHGKTKLQRTCRYRILYKGATIA
jgi:superfamily II DNA helicase RecQ